MSNYNFNKEKKMEKIKGKCKCGKKIDLYEDRTNGTSRVYVYENENPNISFHIFRCKQCKKCISKRFVKDKNDY